ncbi:hypothetical protein V491_02392 [Pseudogymnoascus sp. VKM F-3775]|nr:hypothetical protein V491_02392 [Pseudogymnoascus sp. VKM F-3775]
MGGARHAAMANQRRQYDDEHGDRETAVFVRKNERGTGWHGSGSRVERTFVGTVGFVGYEDSMRSVEMKRPKGHHRDDGPCSNIAITALNFTSQNPLYKDTMKLSATSMLLTLSGLAAAQTSTGTPGWAIGLPCSKAGQVACSDHGTTLDRRNKEIWVCAGSPPVWTYQASCAAGTLCKSDSAKNWAWCQ